MAEHWKSTVRIHLGFTDRLPTDNLPQPKYWCKHCTIYVKDTPFERKQHENTGKHQGNLRRFLRDIQNKHERDEREKQSAKNEVDRLNQKIGTGNSSGLGASIPSTMRKDPSVSKPQPSLADRQRQLAQLAGMGIQIPEGERGDSALAGKWKTMSEREVKYSTQEEPLSTGVRKHGLEDDEELIDESATPQKRRWGVATKTYTSQAKPDLDALLSNATLPRVEKGSAQMEDHVDDSTAVAQIKGPSTSALRIEGQSASTWTDNTKKETIDEPAIEDVPEAGPAVPVFKKRKAKAAAA